MYYNYYTCTITDPLYYNTIKLIIEKAYESIMNSNQNKSIHVKIWLVSGNQATCTKKDNDCLCLKIIF